ncbi:MAG: hypothetical protein WEB88_07545 [Gemmatimonadota bacterium]
MIREWRFANVERVQSEPFAADSNGVVQSITLGPPLEWDDVEYVMISPPAGGG